MYVTVSLCTAYLEPPAPAGALHRAPSGCNVVDTPAILVAQVCDSHHPHRWPQRLYTGRPGTAHRATQAGHRTGVSVE